MTVSHTLFLASFVWYFEFTSKLKQQGKQEKWSFKERGKSGYD